MTAMTSTSDEKWRPFNCFFSRIGLTTYQHPFSVIRYRSISGVDDVAKYRWMKLTILLSGNTSHMEVTVEFNRLHTQRMCGLKGVPYFSLWFQTYGTFCIFSSMIHLSFCCHSVSNNIHQKPNNHPVGQKYLTVSEMKQWKKMCSLVTDILLGLLDPWEWHR